jgi:hypothetical protein
MADYGVWLELIFLPLFAVFWCFVVFVISRFGWSNLADRFAATTGVPHDATRYLWQNMATRRLPLIGPGYNNAINIWLNAEGVWMRPSLPFRMGHALLFLPWSEMVSIDRNKILFSNVYKLQMRGDFLPLTFYGRSGKAIYDHWLSRSPGNRPYPDGRNFGV